MRNNSCADVHVTDVSPAAAVCVCEYTLKDRRDSKQVHNITHSPVAGSPSCLHTTNASW